jgi:hypothetical protein
MVPAEQADATDSPELRKEIFQQHTGTYMRLVQEVNKMLHKQVNALEDANIIPSSKLDYSGTRGGAPEGEDGQPKKETKKDSEATVTNNGLGNLDVSFLNSRAGSLREGMDPEVLERALAILEEMAAPKRKKKKRNNDANMEDR